MILILFQIDNFTRFFYKNYNHFSEFGIVENAEDMSKKWHKIQSRPSTKDQVLGSKNKEDRAKLRAEIQKLLQQSNQVADDCEKIRTAYETSQLRQTLSGTAIQS